MKKSIRLLFLSILLLLSGFFIVSADTAENLQMQKAETKEELDKVQSESSNLEEQKNALKEEFYENNDELIEVLAAIQILEDEIDSIDSEISDTEEEYQAVQNEKSVQYEAMKKRIQYMYEKGDSAYLEVFMKASSFPEMLNKAEYISELYEYDRMMLQEYQNTLQKLESIEETLEEEKSEQEEILAGLEEEEEYFDEILKGLDDETQEIDDLLQDYYSLAGQLSEKLEQQTESIQNETKITSDLSNLTTDSNGITGEDIVEYASQFLGNPYVYGGTSLTGGTDCSGFTMSVYKHFGYSIPRTSSSQRNIGISVASLSDALPGDIICYPGHVALYVGDGMIIHASSSKTGIKYSKATYRTYICIRRIIY